MSEAYPNARQRARNEFSALAAGADSSIDLARAALLIAAEEYLDLDITFYLARLDSLAAQVAGEMSQPPEFDLLKTLQAMNHVLFEQEHFRGNQAHYYNPENSYLNRVLDTRMGIPITLSVLYMEVGKRLGIPIEGIGLPFHFVVRCQLAHGAQYIDPFEKGHFLTEDECVQLVQRSSRGKQPVSSRWFEPVTSRQLLIRMLNNLKYIYLHKHDLERTLSMHDRLLLLAPGQAAEYRDRGIIHFHLKRYSRALRDLNAYLELAPGADDAGDIREQIASIRQLLAQLN